MSAYTAVARPARASGFSLVTELGLPWRLLAVGLLFFGAADVIAREGGRGVATTLFFASYGVVAAGCTLLITKVTR